MSFPCWSSVVLPTLCLSGSCFFFLWSATLCFLSCWGRCISDFSHVVTESFPQQYEEERFIVAYSFRRQSIMIARPGVEGLVLGVDSSSFGDRSREMGLLNISGQKEDIRKEPGLSCNC